MALETKLVQKLGQSLLMTPQLQQAIKLLQLGRLEYLEAIQHELLENPVLEELREESAAKSSTVNEDNGGEADSNAADQSSTTSDSREQQEAPATTKEKENDSPVDWEDYLASFQDARGASVPKGTYDFSDRPSLEATITNATSLKEHILEQVRFQEVTDQDKRILVEIIGNLDKDGFLCSTYEELAETCSCEIKDIEQAIDIVKSLEPAGIAARNLAECLMMQLEAQGKTNSLEARVVSQHLDLLEKRKYDLIAKAEKVSVEDVYNAVMSLRTLDPRPGSIYSEDTTRYIVPDIYVYKDKNEYVISLNEDGLPKLRVSPYYLDLLKNGMPDGSRSYLNERLKAASWLIKSIHQRQQTIFKVTESIVKFQRAFLDDGIHCLKPLVLKDVADDIGMHESTVSRVTTNKYVHTPQGVFELKYFFTTGIPSGTGEVSSSAIKERIRQIIAQEPAENPISDQKIVDLLKEENVKIARRTVAKYREGLGILSSSKRKKLF